MFWRTLALAAALFLIPQTAHAAEPCDAPRESDRVMLVIGNGGYAAEHWPALPNARDDARAVCEAFAAQGFRVIKLEDATRSSADAAIAQFAQVAAEADTALFYFAGHGFEYAGGNFLVPVDAPQTAARAELKARYIDLASAVRAAMKARHAMIFLDACRTRDPVVTVSDADPNGPEGPVGTINLPGSFEGVVFYSTARGRPAFDAAPADAPNSPFAQAVIDRLATPDVELSRYFAFVRADVKERTLQEQGGPQIPTPYGVFDDEFYFRRAASDSPTRTNSSGSSGGSAVVTRASGPSAAEFPAGKALASATPIKLLAGDTVTVITPAGARTFRGPGTFSVTSPAMAAAAVSSRARFGAIRTNGPTSAPADSARQSGAARMQSFDAGRARGALAALTLEMVRREDEPQLIGRLLARASVGDLATLAATGDTTAQYLYGSMLYQGIGVAKDNARARTELAAAAQSGLPAAQLEYAFFLDNFGDGAGDKAQALRLYEAAAAQDWPKAQSHLAYRLWSAAGADRDRDRALDLWRRAAAGGHAYAWYALGAYGQKFAEARRGLQALIARGDAGGHAWLCETQNAADNARAAMASCLTAAQEGFPGPMAILAQIYATGQFGPGSAKEARYWAKLAASKPELDPRYRARLLPLLKDR